MRSAIRIRLADVNCSGTESVSMIQRLILGKSVTVRARETSAEHSALAGDVFIPGPGGSPENVAETLTFNGLCTSNRYHWPTQRQDVSSGEKSDKLQARSGAELTATTLDVSKPPSTLMDIWTPNGSDIWIVGTRGFITYSGDGGRSWKPQLSGTIYDLNAVYGTHDSSHVWAVGAQGVVLRSADHGVHWSFEKSGTTAELTSIFATHSGLGVWAVGANGVVVHSDDSGQSWSSQVSGTTSTLNAIAGSGAALPLCVVGREGAILHSQGGHRWTSLQDPRNAIYTINSLSSDIDGSNFWSVAFSTDGGDFHWVILKHVKCNGAKQMLLKRSPVPLTSIYCNADCSRIWAISQFGELHFSSDGGEVWRDAPGVRPSAECGNYRSITGTKDGSQLWIVGCEGVVFYSSDGGLKWTPQRLSSYPLQGLNRTGSSVPWCDSKAGTVRTILFHGIFAILP